MAGWWAVVLYYALVLPPLKNRSYPESSLAIDDYAKDGGPGMV